MRLDSPIHLPSRVIRRDRLSLRNEKGRVTYEAAAGLVPFRARLPRPVGHGRQFVPDPRQLRGLSLLQAVSGQSPASPLHTGHSVSLLAMDYARRQSAMQTQVGKLRLDPLLVTHLPNVRYLCGFTGSAGVLSLGLGRPVFFTDGRYTAQARQEVAGARVVIAKGSPLLAAAQFAQKSKLRRIGIEAAHMTIASRAALCRALGSQARLRDVGPVVEELRIVKDAGRDRAHPGGGQPRRQAA